MYMEKPLVTVIMPCFNEPKEYLRHAADSILRQTYTNIEFLIILDNPTNNELMIEGGVIARSDSRVSFVVNPENLKLSKSLNRGLSLAKGEIIARLDADDIALPSRIETQMKYVNEYDLISTNFAFINEEGNTIRHRSFPSESDEVKDFLTQNADCMYHTTWLGKKSLFVELGGYREIGPFEDYDFLLRAVLKGKKLYNCKEELNLYRVNPHGISYQNKILQHLGSEYIREHYATIDSITKSEIEAYILSPLGLKHAEQYKKFCDVTSKFYSSSSISRYYAQLLLYGPYLALCNYYGRKKLLLRMKRFFQK